jgi:phenylacetic acid degradation operon negative regulatory protein
MPVRALVAAGGLFGIEENGMRVALVRLRAAGLVERNERGQYRLGPAAGAIQGAVAGWRTLEQRLRPWSGSWIGVYGAGRASERALRLLGFQTLETGLAIRPDNLAGGVTGARARLRDLGLDENALVLGLHDLEPGVEERARGLWDVGVLRTGYRDARTHVERSERRLRSLRSEESMVESFLLGGRVIRQLVLDPLLPEAICPGAERAALVAAMLRYDRAGRSCWSDFLRRYGVLHRRTPADLRLGDGERRRVAAGGTR